MATSIKIFILVLLIGCSQISKPEWTYHSIKAAQPCTRYLLPREENNLRSIEIEWQESCSDAPLYLNIYGPPLASTDQMVKVEISFGPESITAQARLLAGNQRILLPLDLKEKLLDALHNHQPFKIKVGRYLRDSNA